MKKFIFALVAALSVTLSVFAAKVADVADMDGGKRFFTKKLFEGMGKFFFGRMGIRHVFCPPFKQYFHTTIFSVFFQPFFAN